MWVFGERERNHSPNTFRDCPCPRVGAAPNYHFTLFSSSTYEALRVRVHVGV